MPAARARIARRADEQAASRLALEQMLLEPGKHRFERVSRSDLGQELFLGRAVPAIIKRRRKTSIDALEKIHYAMSYSSLSMLETVARENGASADLLEYGKQELEILHRELAYLIKSGATKNEVDLKNAQIATAIDDLEPFE